MVFLHPQKEKLRVLFNCGATFLGVSLNLHLLQEPALTSILFSVLAMFRKEHVVITADVETMFYQMKVRSLLRSDQDYSPKKKYRMTVHLSGATSNPSCANFSPQEMCSGQCGVLVRKYHLKQLLG